MTDRDHFAAAALTGLLYPEVDDEFAMSYIVGRAYLWADAMLRERCREGGDCPGQDNAANLDAVPAVKAGTPGTGDTPKPINDCVSDRSKPITGPDPDSRVWETPVHTPAPHATPGEGSVPRDGTEPVAWGVANGSRVLATSISRMDAVDMQGDYAYHTEIVPLYRHPPVTKPMPQEKQAEVSDRPTPITGPDPDSRVWGTHTHATHATQGECSKPREGKEPVAWAVMPSNSDYCVTLSTRKEAAKKAAERRVEVGEYATMDDIVIVPLYRHQPCQDVSQKNLTLTDRERGAIERAVDSIASTMPYESQQGAADWKTLRGLLERLGGVE